MKAPPDNPRPTALPVVGGLNDEEFAAAAAAFDKDPDVNKARDGMAVRAFWNSKAGQLLEQRAIEIKDKGIVAMLEIDPEDDVKAWRQAKLDVLVAEQLLVWVGETLQEGEIAVAALNDDDPNHHMADFRNPH